MRTPTTQESHGFSRVECQNPAPKATTAVFQWNKPLLGVFRTNLNEELLDSLVADECGTFAVEVKPNEVQTVLVVDKQ
ncbi:glycoside hydrolase [Geobacillus stearothermophilus]|nr:glycoside hydrolase [Geobacillus stearothermophilus]